MQPYIKFGKNKIHYESVNIFFHVYNLIHTIIIMEVRNMRFLNA